MEQQFEKIESYLRGILSPADRTAFEAEIAEDTALAQLVQQHRIERQAQELLVEQDLLSKMRQWDTAIAMQPVEVPLTSTPPPVMRIVRPLKNVMRWAAVFLVCIGAAWYMAVRFSPPTGEIATPALPKTPVSPKPAPVPKPAPNEAREMAQNPKIKDRASPSSPIPSGQDRITQNPVSPELPKQPIPKTESSPSTPDYEALAAALYEEQNFFKSSSGTTPRGGDALYDRALDQYKTGKFSEVERLLKSTLKSDDNKELLAHSLYRDGRYEDAFIYFRELSNARNKTSAQRNEWAMALTLLHQMPSKRNLLDRVLTKIMDNPNHAYYEKAKYLKRKINK